MTNGPQIFVYVNDPSCGQPGAPGADCRAGNGAGSVSGSATMAAHLERAVPLAERAGHPAGGCPAPAAPVPLDPHATHRDFPDKWRAFIRAHYRDLRGIQLAFGVSERTARKWMAGETGCSGGNVALAVQLHPEAAPQMLFAA